MGSIQQQVMDAVVARGYREGWTAAQFVGRQFLKLGEELAEAVQHIGLFSRRFFISPSCGSYKWGITLADVGRVCREIFDQEDPEYCQNIVIEHPDRLRDELADIQVVLFCAAAALGELIGPFDLAQLALEKAQADVERGVRPPWIYPRS